MIVRKDEEATKTQLLVQRNPETSAGNVNWITLFYIYFFLFFIIDYQLVSKSTDNFFGIINQKLHGTCNDPNQDLVFKSRVQVQIEHDVTVSPY